MEPLRLDHFLWKMHSDAIRSVTTEQIGITDMLSIQKIEDAAKFLEGRINRTPVEYSPHLSKILHVPVYMKLEFLQKTGSFKTRGAFYRLQNLSQEEKSRGIVTCSAGNHGKAVAYVAQQLNIKATIFVTRDVDQAKYQGILDYGAEVIRSPCIGYDDTEALALQEAKDSKRTFVSAFDDDDVMAGNGGTLAKEIFEDIPQARNFILPVGGGGWAAGFSVYMKEKTPDCRIIGCQHQDSAGLKLSLEKGEAVTRLPAIQTVAGGIEGGIGANCFKYLQTRIDEVALMSEQEIINGFQWFLDKHQLLIEPTSAVVIAACISGKIQKLNGPTVIVLSGRNVSMTTIAALAKH